MVLVRRLKGGEFLFFCDFFEDFEEFCQALADDIGISADVYEVCVSAPSWYYVHVQMSGSRSAPSKNTPGSSHMHGPQSVE